MIDTRCHFKVVIAIVFAISALSTLDPAAAKCVLGRVAQLPVTMEGMRASVPVSVNGTPTRFWLDSGAFFSIMSKAKAAELGLPTESLPDGFYITGIGGEATARLATIKAFGIGGATLKNFHFVVGGSDAGNGLIGLDLLGAYDADYDFANGTVNLMRGEDCAKSNLAYWAGDKNIALLDLLPGKYPQDDHIYSRGKVNGQDVRLMFDTGASTSFMTRTAGERIGIDLSGAGAKPSVEFAGFGSKGRQSWIVKLASFAVNGEEIRNTPIRVLDETSYAVDADVVLGADFFLAHHILVARGQHNIYMTYNGGPIFSMTTERETGKSVTRTENMSGSEKTAAPTDAAEFARRGAARLTRSDTAGAITDLTEAIRLDPKSSAYYRDRARAYVASGNPAAALHDIDAAVALSPQDPELLISRGLLRAGQHDTAGALADAEAAQKLMAPGSLDNLGLIVLYERLDQPQRNIALLDPIIASHRNDHAIGELLNARCWARGLADIELDKALADCDAAIKRDGAKPQILDSRALIHVRQKNYPAAIADYDAALKAKPDLNASLYMRGWAERAAGDAAKGNADIATAKTRDPGIVARFQPYGFGE